MIYLIAVSLLNDIANKIDKNNLNETEDLFNEIRGQEYLVNNKSFEKVKKNIQYHPEIKCWFRNKNKADEKKNKSS